MELVEKGRKGKEMGVLCLKECITRAEGVDNTSKGIERGVLCARGYRTIMEWKGKERKGKGKECKTTVEGIGKVKKW